MTIHWLDYAIIILYFFVVVYIGYWAMKKVTNFDDYAVAGRGLPMSIFFAAIAATLCGGGATIGRVSFMHTTGIVVFAGLIGVVINQIFSGLYIAGRVHNIKNVYSVGDLFGLYYGRAGRLVSSIVCFFFCLGLFQSFQTAREANDLTYTALLPVAKRDVVRAKYAFCCFIEICYFTLTGAVTLIRMTLLSNAAVYRNNVLMNANLVYLAFVLLILGLFNAIFVGGFFQTAYKFAKPFVKFIIAAFAVVGLGETLFHIPGLAALNAFGFAHMGLQLGILALGILLFSGLTVLSKHRAMRNFERIDL